MKPTKNLNSNLSSPTAITFSRAINEATSTSASSSSSSLTSPNKGITNPVFDSSSSQLVENRSNSQQHYSISKPQPLSNLQTNHYFRSNEQPVSSAIEINEQNILQNIGGLNDFDQNNYRTLVVSSSNIEQQQQQQQHQQNQQHHHHHHHLNDEVYLNSEFDNHSCEECVRFYAKKHNQKAPKNSARQVSRKSTKVSRAPSSVPYLKPPVGFRPHPPQWYYLLGADSNKFRKHKHTYYHKNCKACKAIVRQSFEHYYLGQTTTTAGTSGSGYFANNKIEQNSTTPSESSSTAPLSFDNSDGLITERTSSTSSPQPYNHIMSPSTSNTSSMPPFYVMPRRRASCGHSCLKYTILFYCSVAVILAICAICYFTKMFGYIDPSLSFDRTTISAASTFTNKQEHMNSINNMSEIQQQFNSSIIKNSNSSSNPTTTNFTTFNNELTQMNIDRNESHTSRIIDLLRAEVVALMIASTVMIIFFLGLIGGFLESVLCLRIFGAILSYLFLLTFGAALYIVILLVISHVQSKLILSAISCAGVAITIHAAIAIAPFAFADLISQEKEDEIKELNNISYMKFPSVRFLPMISNSGLSSKRRSSYFSLPFRASKRFLNRNNNNNSNNNGLQAQHHSHSHHPHSHHHHHHQQHQQPHNVNRSSDRATPTESGQHIVFSTHQNHQDNSSSEGLIPAQSSVRFRDNWI